MKKILITLITALTVMLSLSAAFIPVPSDQTDPLFSSPALAIKANEDIDVALTANMGSDFSALSFMADPVKGLDEAARYIAKTLSAVDDIDFWKDNSEITSVFQSLDPENFPTDYRNEEHALWSLQTYFAEHFLSDEFGSVNRAHAVNLLASSCPELFPVESWRLLGGDLELGTTVYGVHAHDGFAWKWDVKLGYGTSESLLRGDGALTLESGVNAAYAFNLFSPHFSLGVNARPSVTIDNIQKGPAFIDGRMNASAISIFSEPMRFGTGISLDLGLLWEPSTDLMFTLDFRNVPSFRSYFEWDLTALAEGNFMPSRDRNIYYEAPDIALSSIWKSESMNFKVEIAHIMDQLLWMNTIDGYDFNYYQVVDLTFEYSLDDALALKAGLGKEKLMLGVEYEGFSAELETKLDRGYLGITVGYAW